MNAGLTDTNLYCIKLSDLSLSARLLALVAASVNYLGALEGISAFLCCVCNNIKAEMTFLQV